MKLDFIPLGKLAVGKTNMRHSKKAPDVSDILPTIRQRGVLVPLLVRPNGEGSAFDIVAGARRYYAARIVAHEAEDGEGEAALLPCAILDDGDDADAIEASLIENIARLDPDEVSRWEAFTRLVKEGRKPDEIAATFGLPDPMVRRILALGNLLPRIRALYRAEKIDAATVRHLTMASKSQQQAWLALLDNPEAHAPYGSQLKAWLFGGQSIREAHALFDVAAAGVAIVADLFGEDRYVADPDAFWAAQNEAIAAKRQAFIDAGWSEVVIIPPIGHFLSWEHEKTPKRKGGRVYIEVRASGEVIVHEGYVSRREAQKERRGDGAGQPGGVPAARPEVTSPMQTYVDLHRHAAVRASLTDHPGVALRLLVAHMICGTHLFRVEPEPQETRNDAVRESVETGRGETVFDEKRRAVLALLGLDPERTTVIRRFGDQHEQVRVFHQLLDLPDPAVMDVLAIVMGEALASGSIAVEAAGAHLGIAMTDWWQADTAFFDLIRDREVLTRIVADVADETVAVANAGSKVKALKAIVQDCLDGTNGRAKVERWVPRWMAFPPATYTDRGGVGTVRAAALVAAALAPEPDPDPASPAPAIVPDEPERLAA